MAVRFRLRESPPCWEKIVGIDVDKLLESGNAWATLNWLVDELTFAKATSAELRRAGLEASSVFIRLLQLTAEYLLHVQASMGVEVASARQETEISKRRALELEVELARVKADRDAHARQCKHYRSLARTASCDYVLPAVALVFERPEEKTKLLRRIAQSKTARQAVFGDDHSDQLVDALLADTSREVVERSDLPRIVHALRDAFFAAKRVLQRQAKEESHAQV